MKATAEIIDPATSTRYTFSKSTLSDLKSLLETSSGEISADEEPFARRKGVDTLTPETMADIFDRYELLARYKKAIAEGKVNIPLEYTAGDKTNRYNASMSEILEALELMGFGPDDIDGDAEPGKA